MRDDDNLFGFGRAVLNRIDRLIRAVEIIAAAVQRFEGTPVTVQADAPPPPPPPPPRAAEPSPRRAAPPAADLEKSTPYERRGDTPNEDDEREEREGFERDRDERDGPDGLSDLSFQQHAPRVIKLLLDGNHQVGVLTSRIDADLGLSSTMRLRVLRRLVGRDLVKLSRAPQGQSPYVRLVNVAKATEWLQENDPSASLTQDGES